MSNLTKICRINDVPQGEGRTFDCSGEPIAIFNVNGQFHAVFNTCPHRGGPLGEGSLDGKVVTCPWHGWQFDVTSGSSPVNPTAKIKKYPVEVEGEDVYLGKPS